MQRLQWARNRLAQHVQNDDICLLDSIALIADESLWPGVIIAIGAGGDEWQVVDIVITKLADTPHVETVTYGEESDQQFRPRQRAAGADQ
jgi:hypothetical protein